MFFLKRTKTKRLEEIKSEEEEAQQRLLQEAWDNSHEDSNISLEFMKGIDTNEIEEVKAYDGEINAMTFNHIK